VRGVRQYPREAPAHLLGRGRVVELRHEGS
jgi:hypothetical protein